jgi:diguanylate cyclase (GGDEF)-like protein
MKSSNKPFLTKLKEELIRFENILSADMQSGNPIFSDIGRIVDNYKELLELSETLDTENRRIKSQLQDLSRSLELTTRIDLMTGLANRRDILGKIEQEFSRAQRHNRVFSVIIADIDDFKLVNENFGFNCGDEVLVEIANLLKVCIRSEDICSRWSGEQFLLLLPETGQEGAESVASKICQTISMTEFRVNKPGIRVTVSLGVSEYKNGDTIFQCISRADKALLQSKSSGKNRYTVLSDPESSKPVNAINEQRTI